MSEQNKEGTIVLENITCHKCGGNIFRKSCIDDGVYICENLVDGKACERTMYYCKHCDKIYDESRYGKHGDVWVCKECENTNWPCTDRTRAIEKAKQLLSMVDLFRGSLKF